MPRVHRLASPRDFRRVLDDGQRATTESVTAIVTTGPNGVRIGVTAGRRMGNAVRRNRAKRQLREAARAIELPEATDAVLIAKPALSGKSFHEIRADVRAALTRALAR